MVIPSMVFVPLLRRVVLCFAALMGLVLVANVVHVHTSLVRVEKAENFVRDVQNWKVLAQYNVHVPIAQRGTNLQRTFLTMMETSFAQSTQNFLAVMLFETHVSIAQRARS